MPVCIYCDHEKLAEDFSLEHILPRDIGGAACPDLFKTHNVCKRCNSLSGLFIDGLFLKSWFTTNNKANDAYKYVDYENGCVMPLLYGGILEAESFNDQICEMWFGPTGDSIYHYHPKYDERYSSYAGGNPISLKQNPGSTYLITATDDPKWLKIVLLSFKEHFKDAQRYSGNLGIDNLNVYSLFFDQIGDEQRNVIDRLKSLRGQTHNLNMAIHLDYDQRFLLKLAIGIGYNLLVFNCINNRYMLKSWAKGGFNAQESSTAKVL